jgi:hypothetical protein
MILNKTELIELVTPIEGKDPVDGMPVDHRVSVVIIDRPMIIECLHLSGYFVKRAYF